MIKSEAIETEDNEENPQQANRYEKLQIYHKVTGKSSFKDYHVLMEAYGKKEMLKLFIKGMMYIEDQRSKVRINLGMPKDELFRQY
jgi:hypothetical protein